MRAVTQPQIRIDSQKDSQKDILFSLKAYEKNVNVRSSHFGGSDTVFKESRISQPVYPDGADEALSQPKMSIGVKLHTNRREEEAYLEDTPG
jgi:hypothetical protein